jgi:undecaprenyl-diphosphatase
LAVPLWFAVLLGLVQGLTEFIPVSSTAHLRILPALCGQPDPGAAFTAVVQLGTLLAVIVYFARDLFIKMPRAMVQAPGSPEGKLPWLLALGTIPIVIVGVSFKSFIVGDARSLYVVATALIVIGVVLLVVDRASERRQRWRVLADTSWATALAIGCAQALALIPGVSRSGATICMALLLGYRRSEAARFSFLLSVPAIAGAGLFEMGDALEAIPGDDVIALALATTVAAISGYAAIAWLMRWLSQRRMTVFGGYRIAVGLALLVLLITGSVHP